jgi:uncharacterized membrane protein
MERLLQTAIGFLVPAIEAFAVLIILVEVVRTFVLYMVAFFRPKPLQVTMLRCRLGQSMVTALEFLVAADILRTAISPQWNDILFLAALIGLRTVLNYVLERELEALDAQRVLSMGYATPEVESKDQNR